MEVRKKEVVQENLKLMSRILNAHPSIAPIDKMKSDFRKHKQMVRSIQKIQKVSQTFSARPDTLNNTVQGFGAPKSFIHGSVFAGSSDLGHVQSAAKIPIKRPLKSSMKVKAAKAQTQRHELFLPAVSAANLSIQSGSETLAVFNETPQVENPVPLVLDFIS